MISWHLAENKSFSHTCEGKVFFTSIYSSLNISITVDNLALTDDLNLTVMNFLAKKCVFLPLTDSIVIMCFLAVWGVCPSSVL